MSDSKRFKLDNAGKLYPSIANTRVSTVFRISVTLVDEVDKETLNIALGRVVKRMPYFNVKLKSGLFWYYFEQSDEIHEVEEEIFSPCMFLRYKQDKRYPYRVLIYKRRISLEVSHSITDGSGALIFLKTLVYEYFKILGVSATRDEYIFNVDDEPDSWEYEDAFSKVYNAKLPKPKKTGRAYKIPFSLCEKGQYNIITGILDVPEVKKVAKEYNSSVTQFIIAVYFMSFQDFFLKQSQIPNHPVVLNVPVNLRGMFEVNTMKNFFLSITLEVDFRLGIYTFEEILILVKGQMSTRLSKKHLGQYIRRNVKSEKNPLIRLIPLVLKDVFMPTIYTEFGEKNYTSSISSLGLVKMPSEIEDMIEKVEVYPPPSRGNLVKITIASYKNNMHISFGSLTDTRELEKYFFRRLVDMEVSVEIETNRRSV